MSAPIFISHSSKDQKTARTICTALENRGFTCWIASRDVGPGENFQEAIVRAIRGAKVMVLLLTENANNSTEIMKELALASHHRILVIPTRVEDVVPSEALAYELATRQWIDLFSDWEQAIQRLVSRVAEVVPIKNAEAVARLSEAAPDDLATTHGPIRRVIAAFNAGRHAVPAVNFAIGTGCVAAIAAVVLGFAGQPRAAVVILGSLLVALVLIVLFALLQLHKNPGVKTAGIAALWAVSLCLVSFLALAATGIGFRWPTIVASILAIEDGVTCGRSTERSVAFSCEPDGDFVVTNIRLDDSDGGLVVREKPTVQSIGRGAIPPNATGVAITGACQTDWCPVRCKQMKLIGWSRQRYLSPRADTLNEVTGRNPNDPLGLTIRTGPHRTCHATGLISYQSRDVILHWCQPSPIDSTTWCRITYKKHSGWIEQGFLEPQH
jgi:uncharacterized membrane protein